MASPHLKILTDFCLFFIIIIGKISQIRTTAVESDHRDGEQFVNRIVDGEKLSEKPGYYLFTAPYRLCDGGCNDSDTNNFAFVFPLYVGKKGKNKYKKLYKSDFKNIHSKKPNAPFKKRTTRYPYTLCPTTITTTTIETTTKTTISKSCIITTPNTTPTISKSSFILVTLKPHITFSSTIIYTTVATSESRPIESPMMTDVETQPTSAKQSLVSERETKAPINYDIEPPTIFEEKTQTPANPFPNSRTVIVTAIDYVIKPTLDYDLEPLTISEGETQTTQAEQFSKKTVFEKETSELNKSEYYDELDNSYGSVTIPHKYSEDYTTNAKGERCPKMSSNKCKKNKAKQVTPEIVTLKRDYEYHKVMKDSRSLDYYDDSEKFRILHDLYFNRQLY